MTLYEELTGAENIKDDIFFPGDVYCPHFIFTGGAPTYKGHVRLADHLSDKEAKRFLKGQYNPSNKWNTEKGAIHLIQRNNTLFAEINLAASATQRFASRPDLGVPIDRFELTASGGFGGLNRNSDPSIGMFVNTLALDGLKVMVSNPIGLYISQVELGEFRDPNNNPVDREKILTTSRGKWDDEPGRARVIRFSIHPPAGADYTLDQCTFGEFKLDTGGPIARKTLIAVHGIGQPESDDEPFAPNPIVDSRNMLVEHPTLRPKFFAGVNWANQLQVTVPEDSIDGTTTRALMKLAELGREL